LIIWGGIAASRFSYGEAARRADEVPSSQQHSINIGKQHSINSKRNRENIRPNLPRLFSSL
jgi:hypothetical protein